MPTVGTLPLIYVWFWCFKTARLLSFAPSAFFASRFPFVFTILPQYCLSTKSFWPFPGWEYFHSFLYRQKTHPYLTDDLNVSSKFICFGISKRDPIFIPLLFFPRHLRLMSRVPWSPLPSHRYFVCIVRLKRAQLLKMWAWFTFIFFVRKRMTTKIGSLVFSPFQCWSQRVLKQRTMGRFFPRGGWRWRANGFFSLGKRAAYQHWKFKRRHSAHSNFPLPLCPMCDALPTAARYRRVLVWERWSQGDHDLKQKLDEVPGFRFLLGDGNHIKMNTARLNCTIRPGGGEIVLLKPVHFIEPSLSLLSSLLWENLLWQLRRDRDLAKRPTSSVILYGGEKNAFYLSVFIRYMFWRMR